MRSFQHSNKINFIAVLSLYQIALAYTTSLSEINNTEWTSLQDSLSDNAALHGPFDNADYETKCESLGTDAYAISDAADGLCMHSHACAYEFCRHDTGVFDLPSYSVDVRTEDDISKVSVSLVF